MTQQEFDNWRKRQWEKREAIVKEYGATIQNVIAENIGSDFKVNHFNGKYLEVCLTRDGERVFGSSWEVTIERPIFSPFEIAIKANIGTGSFRIGDEDAERKYLAFVKFIHICQDQNILGALLRRCFKLVDDLDCEYYKMKDLFEHPIQ